MPLGLGTRLGPYEVVAAIGAGGMGEVYRARDTKLNRDVALKILPEAFASDPDRLARFHREAQVLASLNHPHIGASTVSRIPARCTVGGTQPRWRPDGKELFYISPDGHMMASAIAVSRDGTLDPASPVSLFVTRLAVGGNVFGGSQAKQQYAVARRTVPDEYDGRNGDAADYDRHELDVTSRQIKKADLTVRLYVRQQ
jgi:Protein kinase domain